MHTLKFDSYNLPIDDYVLDDDILVFDTKFPSKDALNAFIQMSSKYCKSGTYYKYQVDTKDFTGRFGNFVYDVENNLRFYMTTSPDTMSYHPHDTVLEYNTSRVINDCERRISMLVDLLQNNGIISSENANMFSPYLQPNGERGVDLCHQVKCLKDYLELTKSTIDDIRKNINNA